MKAIVIGSGLAGLTAALTLAKAGHAVTVFEQADHLGGVTAPFEQDGYRWDLGQLLIEGLGADEPLGRILAELGVLDKIQVVLDDRGYVFRDFELRKPLEFGGARWRFDQLKEIFPQDAAGLERYWRDYLRFTRLMTFARRLEGAGWLSRLYWQARIYLQLLPFLTRAKWSAKQLMDSYFSSEKLQLVFTSILADFFTPPSQFQGLGVFSINPEPVYDKRVPRRLAPEAEALYHYSILGGIGTLVSALAEQIRAHGGELRTSSPVKKIQVVDGRATGVLDETGAFHPADVVIASGGAEETFLRLVGAVHLPKGFGDKVRDIPLMDSIFMLHLGVDFDPRPHVHGVCTYFYNSYDLEGEIVHARQGIYHEGKAGFVVHVPSLHTPNMAPPGCHAMTIYTIAPNQLRQGTWHERKEEFADKLVECAEVYIPGLRAHIRTSAVLTPDDFRQRTHTRRHAFGGLAPVMGAWRIPHRTPLPGLWFIGGQSESGGGVNMVIPGAYRTARKIMEKM